MAAEVGENHTLCHVFYMIPLFLIFFLTHDSDCYSNLAVLCCLYRIYMDDGTVRNKTHILSLGGGESMETWTQDFYYIAVGR